VPVLDAVRAARYRFEETSADARKATLAALERVGMKGTEARLLSELSGGERQRVALAALFVQEARVLLLDEPANHLDPAQQAETYALIAGVLDSGAAVLTVTHDVNLLAHLSKPPRILCLKAGRLAATTSFDAPDLPATLSALFGVPMQALEAAGRRVIVPLPTLREERRP
jgi:iron complex transport system ATP-binding protein